MESPKPQISSTSYLSNSISEPPDIKQWFSSYTYQSPDLDTNEKDLCFSHGIENEERGLYVEDSETEDDQNGEDFSKRDGFLNCKSIEEDRKHEVPSLSFVEVPTYPDSYSMPSEPPDIAKWFSSYVYECPELDSTDSDVSLSNDSTFGEKKEVDKEREDHLKGLPVIQVTDEVLSCKEKISRFTPTLKAGGSEKSTLYPENDLSSARAYDETNYELEFSNCNKIQNKSFENPRIKSEDILPTVKIEKHISCEERLKSPPKTPFSTSGGFTNANEEKKTELKHVLDKSDSGWVSLNRSKPREENQVTITKNKVRPRLNKENCDVKPICTSDRPKDETSKRGILKETTNFNFSCVSEVSGKWRCPQKYKPESGPPMKQLRLEKWFHR